MAEFTVKLNHFELRSCSDPFDMAEILFFTDEDDKESIRVLSYTWEDGKYVIKLDTMEAVKYKHFDGTSLEKLLELLIAMVQTLLLNQNEQIVVTSIKDLTPINEEFDIDTSQNSNDSEEIEEE